MSAQSTEVRPLYWSIRREIWENRSIYLAPLIVAGVVLFASMFGTFSLPKKVRHPVADPVKQHTRIVLPFSMAPAPIMFATFIVGMFYSLDALYGERRDRSILFWKSLPVSDGTTVLAKALIPMAVLPAIAFVLSIVAQGVLLFAGTAVLAGSGLGPGALWGEFRYVQETLIMIYGLVASALWFAPIYAWFTLISAWARRSPFLWAILPAFVIAVVEKITMNSMFFLYFLRYRFVGMMDEAFTVQGKHAGTIDQLSQTTPIRFLTSFGLWGGLIFAAIAFAASLRLRRNREPI